MWFIPLCLGTKCATTGLRIALQAPSGGRYAQLNHLAKHLGATCNSEFEISPGGQVTTTRATITVSVDSGRDGCNTTRKSTAWGVLHINGVCLHHDSMTQASVAHSLGEANIYAIGSGVSAALGLNHFLHELGSLSTRTVCAESSAA